MTCDLPQVQPIVQAVMSRGDAAVKQYTEKFDHVQLDTVCSPIEVRIHVNCSSTVVDLGFLAMLEA